MTNSHTEKRIFLTTADSSGKRLELTISSQNDNPYDIALRWGDSELQRITISRDEFEELIREVYSFL